MISWVKIVVDFLDLLLIKWKEEWNRPLHTLNAQQDHKLMFGLLFSLKSLTAKMDPTRFVLLLQVLNFKHNMFA